jgi:hypothetical protein
VRAVRSALLTAAAAFAAGCNSDSPSIITWTGAADTTAIYSASRPEFAGRISGFDFTSGFRVAIDAPGTAGNFDIALIDQGSSLALVPNGVLESKTNGAGLYAATDVFENLVEAPKDTLVYKRTGTFPLPTGQIYVIRSRDASCSGVGGGFYYSKLQVLDVNVQRGTATFRWVRNPFCDDRALVAKK